MDKVEVSIIVPVYNTEPYVAECIDSILAQTYPFWELILVDDGSTDASGCICGNYAQKDGRIRFFHQENRGVSCARNVGILHSRGKYLLFVDSDDVIRPLLLEKAVAYMEKECTDLLYFDLEIFVEEGKGKEELETWEPEIRTGTFWLTDMQERVRYILEEYMEFHACYFLCNKIFRTSLIRENRIVFEDSVRMGEDIGFIIQCLFYAQKVSGIPESLAGYRIRHGSAMNSFGGKKFWLNDFVAMLKGVWYQGQKVKISRKSYGEIYMKVMDNQYRKREMREEYREAVQEITEKNRKFFAWQTCMVVLHPWRVIKIFGNPEAKRKWKDNLYALGYLLLPGK